MSKSKRKQASSLPKFAAEPLGPCSLSQCLLKGTAHCDGSKLSAVEKYITEIDAVDPSVSKCRTVFLSNNEITEIENLRSFKNLKVLSLANNFLSEFEHLAPLKGCPNVQILNLAHNPITQLPNYRLHVINLFPNLKLLDNVEISMTEREHARIALKREETLLNLLFSNQCLILKLKKGVEKLQLQNELQSIVFGRLSVFNQQDPPLDTQKFDTQKFLRLFENFDYIENHSEKEALFKDLRTKVRQTYYQHLKPKPSQALKRSGKGKKSEKSEKGKNLWDEAFSLVMLEQQKEIGDLLTSIEVLKQENIQNSVQFKEKHLESDPRYQIIKLREEEAHKKTSTQFEREELISEFRHTIQQLLQDFVGDIDTQAEGYQQKIRVLQNQIAMMAGKGFDEEEYEKQKIFVENNQPLSSPQFIPSKSKTKSNLEQFEQRLSPLKSKMKSTSAPSIPFSLDDIDVSPQPQLQQQSYKSQQSQQSQQSHPKKKQGKKTPIISSSHLPPQQIEPFQTPPSHRLSRKTKAQQLRENALQSTRKIIDNPSECLNEIEHLQKTIQKKNSEMRDLQVINSKLASKLESVYKLNDDNVSSAENQFETLGQELEHTKSMLAAALENQEVYKEKGKQLNKIIEFYETLSDNDKEEMPDTQAADQLRRHHLLRHCFREWHTRYMHDPEHKTQPFPYEIANERKLRRYLEKKSNVTKGTIFSAWRDMIIRARRQRHLTHLLEQLRTAKIFNKWRFWALQRKQRAVIELDEKFEALKSNFQTQSKRISSVDLENLQLVENLQDLVEENTKYKLTIEQKNQQNNEFRDQLEECNIIIKSLKSELEQSRTSKRLMEQSVAKIQSKSLLQKEKFLESGLLLKEQTEKQKILLEQLKSEAKEKQKIIDQFTRHPKKDIFDSLSFDTTALESSVEMTDASHKKEEKQHVLQTLEIAGELRCLLDEKDHLIKKLEEENKSLNETRHESTFMMEKTLKEKDHTIEKLAGKLHKMQNKVLHEASQLQDYSKELQKKDKSIQKLQYEVELMAQREQQNLDSFILHSQQQPNSFHSLKKEDLKYGIGNRGGPSPILNPTPFPSAKEKSTVRGTLPPFFSSFTPAESYETVVTSSHLQQSQQENHSQQETDLQGEISKLQKRIAARLAESPLKNSHRF